MKMPSDYKWEKFGTDIVDFVLVLLVLTITSGAVLWIYGMLGGL